MKSKKIVALIVAFAAFMAVATSGLAATTTTTYLGEKVSVKAEIAAETGKEVTYLVKSGNEIVYIDQQTAKDSKAVFNYKVAKNKIVDLTTDVQFGTNGTAFTAEALTGKELLFSKVEVTKDAGVNSVKFYSDEALTTEVTDLTLGNAETEVLYAVVDVDSKYELVAVKINNVAQDNVDGKYAVRMGDKIDVTTKLAYVAPKVEADTTVIEKIPAVDAEYADTTKYAVNNFAIKVTAGTPTKVGVLVGDMETGSFYPALTVDDAPYNANDVYAVRIITAAGKVIEGSVVCE
ncbi:MAG: hypothetical protein IJN40_02960 [Clostridia bacterium]|nr:hypothetical protein [Clostridia bacterium]